MTLEFLDRLQDEEEKIPEVIFQQLAEEYSPWKGVEVATEKKEFKEERPTTFAQAVALRLNGTNGLPQTSDAVKREWLSVPKFPQHTYPGLFQVQRKLNSLLVRLARTHLPGR